MVSPTSFAVTETVLQVLTISQQYAEEQDWLEVTCTHVLLVLLNQQDTGVQRMNKRLGIDVTKLRLQLQEQLQFSKRHLQPVVEESRSLPSFSSEVIEAMQQTLRVGGDKVVTSVILLFGIAATRSKASGLLRKFELSPEKVRGVLAEYPELGMATGGKPAQFDLASVNLHVLAEVNETPPTQNEGTAPRKPLEKPVDLASEQAGSTVKSQLPPKIGLLLNEEDVFIQDNELPAIGVTDIAAELCSLIRNLRTADRGKMVGVFGAWGRGKTFLLDLIGVQIPKDGPTPFHQVKFHAWKYQDTPASWAYLYEAFANAYYADSSGEGVGPAVWWRARKIMRLNTLRNGYYSLVAAVISGLLLVVAGIYLFWSPAFSLAKKESEAYLLLTLVGMSVPISIGLITFVRNALQASYNSALSLFHRYYRQASMEHLLGVQAEVQKELRILLRAWLDKQPTARVLLIVDDIDRCDEQKVIQIIDALRVMLEDPHISARVVVLAAIDERILKNAIKHKYAEFFRRMDGEQSAIEEYRAISEYLDKLFISGLRLGPLSSPEMCEIFTVYSKAHLQPEETAENSETSLSSSRDLAKSRVIVVPTKQGDAGGQQAAQTVAIDNLEPAKEELNELTATAAPTKSSYTLSGAESTFIRSLLMQQDIQMTPRQIRIYYYRYLLARNMLLKRLKSTDASANSAISREVLLRVLLVHFFQDTNTIATAKRQVYAAQQDGPMPSLGADSTYRLTKREMLEIYAVTELVTGY